MITAGSEYNGKELLDVVLRPVFVGAIPMGIRTIYTDGSGSVKQTFFANGGHNLMAYADGFQGGNASIKKQKKFELAEFKTENEYSKQDYLTIIQRQASDIKTAFQNDIFKKEYLARFSPKFGEWLASLDQKTMLLTLAELEILQNGVDIGIFNNFWLGDKNKTTYSTGTFPNQATYLKYAADTRFNPINGIWTNIMANASLTPTADQVQKVAMANGAVAQVSTITVSGGSGSGTITVNGMVDTVTFDTDLTTTNANFVTANAADYLLRNLVLTSSVADIIITSSKPGLPFDAPVFATVATLAGSVAATTANTKAGAMAADEARDKMNAMVKIQSTVMDSMNEDKKVFWATNTWIRNYKETLGTDGSDAATSESARTVMTEGIKQLYFNGIPVLRMPIDSAISAYFEDYSPHRCILTTRENLAMILSSAGEFGESALWWNKDENTNRTRVQLEFGADYWLPELIVAAFQG